MLNHGPIGALDNSVHLMSVRDGKDMFDVKNFVVNLQNFTDEV